MSRLKNTALLELDDEGNSRLLFIKGMITDTVDKIRIKLPTGDVPDVIQSNTNVPLHLQFDSFLVNFHAPDIHTTTTATGLFFQNSTLESQINKLVSSHSQ